MHEQILVIYYSSLVIFVKLQIAHFRLGLDLTNLGWGAGAAGHGDLTCVLWSVPVYLWPVGGGFGCSSFCGGR